MKGGSAVLGVVLLVACTPVAGDAPAGPGWIDPSLPATGPGPVPVIVQTDAPPDATLVARLAGHGDVLHVYDVIDAIHLLVEPARLAGLAAEPGVARIDADAPLAWHLDTSVPAINVGPALRDQGFDGSGVRVAVVDTGVDARHPGLRGRVVHGVVFGSSSGPAIDSSAPVDREGHGTHVAGVVAGTGSGSTLLDASSERFRGVATGAEIVSLDISSSFTTSTAIRAFDWIHENHEAFGIRVVQNSWGRQEVGEPYDPRDPALRASDALVVDDGLVVVFSAANKGPGGSTLSMEAMNPNVLTVGATDDAGRVASFSSRGPVLLAAGATATWTKPDIAAPGVRIMSAASTTAAPGGLPTGSAYRELSGTSQAAPHAAGVAAMLVAHAPELDPFAVMDLMRRSAHDLGPPGPDAETGAGMLRAGAALDLLLAGPDGIARVAADETYAGSGRLTAGNAALAGLLPPNTGASAGIATGRFPVKPDAARLDFALTWTAAVGPLPRLDVALSGPGGAAGEAQGTGSAAIALETPAAGEWTWRATPSDASWAGAADWDALATVAVPGPVLLGGPFGGGGGFFDEPTGLQEYMQAVRDDPRVALPVVAVAAVLLLLVAAVRAFRR